MTPEERERYDAAFDAYMPRFRAAFGDNLFGFVHSDDASALLREAHATMVAASGDPGAGWPATTESRNDKAED